MQGVKIPNNISKEIYSVLRKFFWRNNFESDNYWTRFVDQNVRGDWVLGELRMLVQLCWQN